MDKLILTLYLNGVSTGDFVEAILGKEAPELSATSVVRLTAPSEQPWEQEYQEWTRRKLSGKRHVYFGADDFT